LVGPYSRDLAVRYGVSRASVREAVRVLEAMGIVSVRRGAEHGVVLLREPGAEHRAIHDALAGGDGERAAALVTDHIRYWGHRVRGG
jgi:DNA-binding FadR family transcriptional regulator